VLLAIARSVTAAHQHLARSVKLLAAHLDLSGAAGDRGADLCGGSHGDLADDLVGRDWPAASGAGLLRTLLRG
jgi:hypothetical protein